MARTPLSVRADNLRDDSGKVVIGRFQLPILVIVIAVGVLGIVLDMVPDNMVGAFSVMFALGIVLTYIGDRIPIWNDYVGGGIVLTFMVTALLVQLQWLPPGVTGSIERMMEDWGFLNLYVTFLICGSILSIDRKMLLRSLTGMIPAIAAGLLVAGLFGVLAGMAVGRRPAETLILYVIPIMGGGTGAGAVPMSEIFASTTGQNPSAFMAVAYPILTIANILCILAASVMVKLFDKNRSFSGQGALMRRGKSLDGETEKKVTADLPEVAAGATLAVSTFALGYILSEFTDLLFGIEIHTFAWMIILLTVFNIAGIVSPQMKAGAGRLQKFFVKWMTAPLMVGVGVAYIDLGEMAAAINPGNMLIAVCVVLGAIVGSASVGWLVGFYPLESSVCAGLCMANRGGAGDVAVLGAAKRMDLMAYAQIASRIGGGIVLILAGFIFPLL